MAELSRDVEGAQLPLIWSKLHPPVARQRVARTRLLQVLCGPKRKLTVIRAPAGWGKSTVLADWQTSELEARPFAWFGIDEQDNDPVRFWTYVIEALHRVSPGLGESSRALVQTPGVDAVEAMLPVLINELEAASGDIVLVLDDYHLIEHERIHDGIAFLLKRLPRSVELVLATRSEPPLALSRLRASGELLEIDALALAFSADEAADLLNGLHGLGIGASEVATLRARTEGWVAGLNLARRSARGREARTTPRRWGSSRSSWLRSPSSPPSRFSWAAHVRHRAGSPPRSVCSCRERSASPPLVASGTSRDRCSSPPVSPSSSSSDGMHGV